MDSNIKGTDEFERRFRAAAEYAVNRALQELKGRAVSRAPQSKSDPDEDNAPGSLKRSGAITDADWKGNSLRGDVHFGLVYAEVQERGYWRNGLRRVEIKNYSTPGTGKDYLRGSLDEMRPGYQIYLQRKMKEKLR